MIFPDLPLLQGAASSLFPSDRHHLLDTCGSTNDVARILALDGAPEGTVVLADAQTEGRGRLGRSWHSPPGANIHLSVLLRPSLPARQVPLLTLALAVAAVDAVRGVDVDAWLKWPNDLVVDTAAGRRKLAGIACEAVTHPRGGGLAVVAGLGVDVNLRAADLPPELRELATSMRTLLGRDVDRAALVATILEQLAGRYDDLQRTGPRGILPAYRRRLETVGRRVTVDLGNRRIEGVAEDLGGGGELRVRLDDGGLETITAGDVGME